MSKKLKISVFLFMLLGMFVFLGGALQAVTITYKAGADSGVTGTMAVQNTDTEGKKLKDCAFERSGYEFKEWKVSNGKSSYWKYEENLAAGAEVRTDKDNLTATAQWNKLYELTINGASGLSKDVIVDSVKQGTVTLTKNFVINGGKTTITITPAEGYVVDTFSVGGFLSKRDLTETDTGYKYDLTHMLNKDADVVVTFKLKEFTLEVNGHDNHTTYNIEHGSYEIASNTIKYGKDYVVTFIPESAAYKLASLTVGGSDVLANAVYKDGKYTYTITNVKGNVSVVGSFAMKTYSFKVNRVVDGVTSPVADEVVNYGASKTVKAEIARGYELINVTLNGKAYSVDQNNELAIANITEDTVVNINIKSEKYEVVEGEDQTINVSKDEEFVIRVDGDMDLCVAVYVDDELVDPENYELSSGSTIVTFKEEFVAGLKNGKHKVSVEYQNGNTAETSFVIARNKNPETGDNTSLYVISVVSAMVVATGAVVFAKKKAKQM